MELIPELMKLLRTKSMIRYLPPKGTAGLARSRVRGKSRVPLPPARTMPNTRRWNAPCAAKANSRSEILFSGNRPSQYSLLTRCHQTSRRGSLVLRTDYLRRRPIGIGCDRSHHYLTNYQQYRAPLQPIEPNRTRSVSHSRHGQV